MQKYQIFAILQKLNKQIKKSKKREKRCMLEQFYSNRIRKKDLETGILTLFLQENIKKKMFWRQYLLETFVFPTLIFPRFDTILFLKKSYNL